MEGDTPLGIVQRPLPNAVTYDLTTPKQVTITLPPASTWSSGLHWHEAHDEYLKIVKGSIRVRLGNTTQVLTATDESQPEVKVDRFVWHEWQRSDPEGEVVVIERTDPVDNDKAIFFWNLNGVILNAPKLLNDPSSFVSRCPSSLHGPLLDAWITLNLWVVFYHLDNVPVFLNAPSFVTAESEMFRNFLLRVDWVVSHLVLCSAAWLGWFLGVEPVRLEYTPAHAYADWRAKDIKGERKEE
ncbi:hypothetical protein G7046_g115 [Stylonectria norvegica]|nr:hypothetical protein G7046_g115 [Stylonectria norvegica]